MEKEKTSGGLGSAMTVADVKEGHDGLTIREMVIENFKMSEVEVIKLRASFENFSAQHTIRKSTL